MKVNIELFCGTAGFTKISQINGIECISFDSRRREGTCEPCIRVDINEIDLNFFKGLDVFILWAGLPCDIWSYASGGFHLDNNFNPKTEKAKEHLRLFFKTIEIIEICNPDFYFIENPRGKLRNFPPVLDMVKNTQLFIHETSLDNYGFQTIKPTNIFTNFKKLELKPVSRFGRGNKNNLPGTFDNLTKSQRQKTPEKLYKSIINQCLKSNQLF
jgi:hypothetical protein